MDTVTGGSTPYEIIFPSKHYMPKEITQQAAFLEKYPEYDGRGIKIAIIDSGVDPSCPGLQKTTDGKPKVIECMDLSGSGDVDTSSIKKAYSNGILIGLTERELKIPKTWKNPSGEWHLGIKAIHELYSEVVKDRINDPVEEKFAKRNKSEIAKAMKELNEHEKKVGTKTKKISDKEDREEINAKLEYLKEAEKLQIESPTVDCIVWFDGEKWKACLDTTLTGDLQNAKVMSSFCENQEYGFISEKCIVSYCLNIHENGNLLEICVPDGSHGTHVAHIAAGHFPGTPEKDGLAPGAQIISLRIAHVFTSRAVIRALNKCIELKVDVINLSCQIASCMENGKNERLIKEMVEKHGIILVASAGNDGPGLSVAGNTPGIAHPSIIFVGAYLTAEMKEAMFSHYSADESVVFPFSSRGPCLDGSLGVTFCAPGAAIAGVPKHDLLSSELGKGTSMSSPNAVGNIACLLSAMKAESIPISQFRVKLSLCNTASAPEDGSHHPFSLGAGIIQICSAFDFLKSEAMKLIPTNLTDIKVSVDFEQRGMYLREPEEILLPSESMVSVTPEFTDSGDHEARLNFGCPVMLKLSKGSEEGVVKFPKYCQIPSPTFKIFVDPTKLEAGKVHYAQIIGINPENPSFGPLFHIPITVIIPEQVTPESDYCFKKELTLKAAIPERIFIQSPAGCKYVGIKIKSLENQNVQYINIQQLYLDQKNRCYKKAKEGALYAKQKGYLHISCPENQTIEYCIAQDWNNQYSTKIKISIKFLGFFIQPTTLMSINSINKIFFTNALSENYIEPILEFKSFCQPLSPSEVILESMKERDIIDGCPSLQLLLTYKFYVSKWGKYKFIHEDMEFYEKYMDSYLLQISTASKKRIQTFGIAGWGKLLEKGDYVIHVKICHTNSKMLEKLKDIRLIAMEIFDPEISCNLYDDARSALNDDSVKKIKKEIVRAGKKFVFYVPEIPSLKYPITYSSGSYLMGNLFLHSNDAYNSKDHSSFDILYLLAAPKSFLNDANGRLEIESDKDNNEVEDLKSEIRDIEISYITKETDATKAAALFEKLTSEFPTHIPIYSAVIEGLSKIKDFAKLKKMVEKLMEISESKEIAEFFGVKSEFNEENLRKKEKMEKKVFAIENALFLQANLGLDLFLKATIKDIPEAFRNGFDPKKMNDVKSEFENDERIVKFTPFTDIDSLLWVTELTDEDFNEMSKNENSTKEFEEKIDSEKMQLSSSKDSLAKTESPEPESNHDTSTKECGNANSKGKEILHFSSFNDSSYKTESLESNHETPKKDASKTDDEKISTNAETAEITLEEIEKCYRDYMLVADSSTENAKIIQAKYSVAHERFGTALLKLKEIIADKTTTSDYLSTEKAIIQLLERFEWNHLVEEAQKTLLIKHQNVYRLF